MWIIQEPNMLELWKKLHFEEKKMESIYHVKNIQYLYLLNKYIKCNFRGQRCGMTTIVDIRRQRVNIGPHVNLWKLLFYTKEINVQLFCIFAVCVKKIVCRENHASPSTLFKIRTARHIMTKCFTDIVYTVSYRNTSYVQICVMGLTAA